MPALGRENALGHQSVLAVRTPKSGKRVNCISVAARTSAARGPVRIMRRLPLACSCNLTAAAHTSDTSKYRVGDHHASHESENVDNAMEQRVQALFTQDATCKPWVGLGSRADDDTCNVCPEFGELVVSGNHDFKINRQDSRANGFGRIRARQRKGPRFETEVEFLENNSRLSAYVGATVNWSVWAWFHRMEKASIANTLTGSPSGMPVVEENGPKVSPPRMKYRTNSARACSQRETR